MAEPPKFSFGAPASSGSSAPSLFGSAANKAPNPTAGGSLFGNMGANKDSTPPSAGGFNFGTFGGAASTGNGNGNATPTSAGFSFGQKADANKATNPTTPAAVPTGNPFGAATGGNLFGAPSATPANKPPLFSTTPAGPPPAQNGGLFGGIKTNAAPGGGLFGQKPHEEKKDADKPVFGGLLGGQKPADSSAPKPAFAFQKPDASASATAPQSAPLFGAFNQPKKDDAPKPAAPAGGLFGAKPADGAAAPKVSFNLGASDKGPSSAPASQPTFSLGGGAAASQPASSHPAPATSAPTSNLFGGASSSAATPAAPAANLFGGLGQKKDDAPKPATPTGPMFGKLGGTSSPAAPASSAAAPASTTAISSTTPAFSLGGQAASSAAAPTSTTATSAPTPAFSLGNPPAGNAPASTAAPSSSTPAFSLNQPSTAAATAGSSTAPAPTTTTPALGASTSGPTPPTTSRLNSKSLDEIITLWTTSLSTHQKSFNNLATKISSWDRMLVENSDKISKLYSRTFQAERDTAEVERQLATVEGQQEELSHWLDHYEKVLDDMAAKAGGVESGVDAERERTYRTAERCSTRLTTMSHDLTSMIEEINLASTNLSKSSKTAESDPLSQIVRVLNAHLSQLQQIDSGAEQLRAKVEAAQKEVRGFGGRVGDEGGVEGFMRSLRR